MNYLITANTIIYYNINALYKSLYHDILYAWCHCMLFIFACICLHVFIHTSSCDARSSNKQEQNVRNLSFWEAMAPGVPLALLAICYYTWSIISPNDVMIAQPRVFLFSMGIVFSNIAVSVTCVHNVMMKYVLMLNQRAYYLKW